MSRNCIVKFTVILAAVIAAIMLVKPASAKADTQMYPIIEHNGSYATNTCDTFLLDYGSGNHRFAYCNLAGIKDEDYVQNACSSEIITVYTAKSSSGKIIYADSDKIDGYAFHISFNPSETQCEIYVSYEGTDYYLKNLGGGNLAWEIIPGHATTFYVNRDSSGNYHFKTDDSSSAGELYLWDEGLAVSNSARSGCRLYNPLRADKYAVFTITDSDGSKTYEVLKNGSFGGDAGVASITVPTPKTTYGFDYWSNTSPTAWFQSYDTYIEIIEDAKAAENFVAKIISEDNAENEKRVSAGYIEVNPGEQFSYTFTRPSDYSLNKNYVNTNIAPRYSYPVTLTVNGNFDASIATSYLVKNSTSRIGEKFTSGEHIYPGQWILVDLPRATRSGYYYKVTGVRIVDKDNREITLRVRYDDNSRAAVIYMPSSGMTEMKITVETTRTPAEVEPMRMYAFAQSPQELEKILPTSPLVYGGDWIWLFADDHDRYSNGDRMEDIYIQRFVQHYSDPAVDAHVQELVTAYRDMCSYSYTVQWYVTKDGRETPVTNSFVPGTSSTYYTEDLEEDVNLRFRCKVIRIRDCNGIESEEYWSDYRDITVKSRGPKFNAQIIDAETVKCGVTSDKIYVPYVEGSTCRIRKDNGAWETVTQTCSTVSHDNPRANISTVVLKAGPFYTYTVTGNGTYEVEVSTGLRTECGTVTYNNIGTGHDPHESRESFRAATMDADGGYTLKERCSTCGEPIKTTNVSIDRVETVSLDRNEFEYSGSAVQPVVTVKDSKGQVLAEDTDYTVVLSTDEDGTSTVDEAAELGTYYLIVSGKTLYNFRKVLSFTVAEPKKSGNGSSYYPLSVIHENNDENGQTEEIKKTEDTGKTEEIKESEETDKTEGIKKTEETDKTKKTEETNKTEKTGDSGKMNEMKDTESVTIPDDVKKVKAREYKNCEQLSSVEVGANVKKLGTSAFYGCSSLTEVSLPEGLKEIGGYAFKNCASLEEIVLPGSVTKLGRSVFSGCKTLKEADISENIEKIGKNVFYGCSSLEKLVIRSDKLTADSVAVGAFAKVPGSMVIYVPAEKVTEYKALFRSKGLSRKVKVTAISEQ